MKNIYRYQRTRNGGIEKNKLTVVYQNSEKIVCVESGTPDLTILPVDWVKPIADSYLMIYKLLDYRYSSSNVFYSEDKVVFTDEMIRKIKQGNAQTQIGEKQESLRRAKQRVIMAQVEVSNLTKEVEQLLAEINEKPVLEPAPIND